jgi:cytochrome c oxidase subunit I+III
MTITKGDGDDREQPGRDGTQAALAPRGNETGLGRDWAKPTGRLAWFADVSHKSVGRRLMITAFIFFLLGGVEALLLRVQLARPEQDFLSAQLYNELFTMHGTTMMFLFAVPFLEGLAIYLLPLKLGTRDMPFPRFNTFNYFCFLAAGVVLYSSFVFALVPAGGWFAYVPLTGPEFFADKSMDFWLFGLALAEIAAIGTAIEIVLVILRMRAPGMTLDKIPIFVWALLATGMLIILAFVPLLVATGLLELDRAVGTVFFDAAAGGDPLLWQHLFWIFGHPEVYVMFLPATGIISAVIAVHARRGIAAYSLVVVAIIVTALISMGLWVHHMYTTGLPPLTLSFFTAASMTIAIATGIQIVAWISTIWLGRPSFTVPMLYAVGFIITFVLGGITGVMVASVPFDEQAHDTFFIVAHFHYVLIGGVLFPIFAGLYHWMPKMTGRMPSRMLGLASFWLVFVGFHVTFFPLHLAGLWGMPRRVYTFPRDMGIDAVNMMSTIGAFVLAAGVVVFTVAIVRSWFRGPDAGDDPWGGDTLEWRTASPPSRENFTDQVTVADRHPQWAPPADDTFPEIHRTYGAGPTEFRSVPGTSIMTAEPECAIYLPRNTAWPITPVLGLVVIIIALLADWYPVAFVGVAVIVLSLIVWGVQNENEQAIVDHTPMLGGYELDTSGAKAIGWWGYVATITISITALTTLVFSYFFLQVNSEVWPDASAFGGLLLPVLSVAGFALALAATAWGSLRQRDRDHPAVNRGAQALSAVIAMLAGAVATVCVVAYLFASDTDPTAHAYDSMGLAMIGLQLFNGLAAIGVTGTAILRISRFGPSRRPRLLLQGSASLWGLALVSWVVIWLILHISPGVI